MKLRMLRIHQIVTSFKAEWPSALAANPVPAIFRFPSGGSYARRRLERACDEREVGDGVFYSHSDADAPLYWTLCFRIDMPLAPTLSGLGR